ncbi:hypothetical protein SORBI_3003G204750 [Sorghum bicolor]|uniref:Uncharacterized protein n=1 Tax=Sorghum bicolor TaxID=4558 RepID=A0A1W0VYA5_SORBI|nr:hypothetical protein SORBI_3003G204750 [Sorghum bicolor]
MALASTTRAAVAGLSCAMESCMSPEKKKAVNSITLFLLLFLFFNGSQIHCAQLSSARISAAPHHQLRRTHPLPRPTPSHLYVMAMVSPGHQQLGTTSRMTSSAGASSPVAPLARAHAPPLSSPAPPPPRLLVSALSTSRRLASYPSFSPSIPPPQRPLRASMPPECGRQRQLPARRARLPPSLLSLPRSLTSIHPETMTTTWLRRVRRIPERRPAFASYIYTTSLCLSLDQTQDYIYYDRDTRKISERNR